VSSVFHGMSLKTTFLRHSSWMPMPMHAAGGQLEIKMQKVQQCRRRGPPLHWAKEDNLLPSREKKGRKSGDAKAERLKTGKAALDRME
jgi:hypothetical protein